MASHRSDHLLLSTLPDQYLTKRPVVSSEPLQLPEEPKHPTAQQQHSLSSSRSSSSLRKSSGSYSIYSTFGGDESIYSVDDSAKKEIQESFDTMRTAVTSPTSLNESIEQEKEDEETDLTDVDDDSYDDDDDDAFVDATGLSQDDIEKERRNEINKNLSKRLSGGHFGSAGGLLSSIHPDNDTTPPVPSIPNKRMSKNTPTDEDLAKSMLNWKRHSDSSKRWSATIRQNGTHCPPLNDEYIDSTEKKDTTVNASCEVKEQDLSIPDMLAQRKETEEVLSGNKTPPLVADTATNMAKSPTETTLNSLSSSSTLNDPSSLIISNAELFSKTIDDVWKTSSNTLDLFNDPNSLELQNSIQNIENSTDKFDEKIKDTAMLLWKEDESVVSKERMAEWLGQGYD